MLNTGPLVAPRNRWLNGKYWNLTWPGHPHAFSNGTVREHVHLAAAALGKPLPRGSVVHHVDGDTRNNTKNLVLCEDVQYHNLLHRRQRALDECGDANARRCHTCGKYDRQDEIVLSIRHRTDTVSKRIHDRAEHFSCQYQRHLAARERARAGLVVRRGPNKNASIRSGVVVWRISPEERTAIGKKGGAARRDALTSEQRVAIATKASMAAKAARERKRGVS